MPCWQPSLGQWSLPPHEPSKTPPGFGVRQSSLLLTRFFKTRRDCVLQPRVARNELPWGPREEVFNPERVVAGRSQSIRSRKPEGHNPFRIGSVTTTHPG